MNSDPPIQVIDNALADVDADRLRDAMTSTLFPWYFNDTINGSDYPQADNVPSFQFTHSVVRYDQVVSDFMPLFMPLIHKLDPLQVRRIKANLNTQHHKPIVYGLHRDRPPTEDDKIAIYYPITADGPTVFEDGTSVDPVANRLVLFPSSLLHSGTTPVTSSRRIVVNVIYR